MHPQYSSLSGWDNGFSPGLQCILLNPFLILTKLPHTHVVEVVFFTLTTRGRMGRRRL